MDDAELIRYARHILLEPIGIEGQARIRSGRVLIIGLGGLGCASAQYLTSAGVGQLILVDQDTVDASNLQRQILYRTADLGQAKAQVAARFLQTLNPDVSLLPLVETVAELRLRELCEQVDVVVDCSDNFATRHAVNRACVATRTALVSGAAGQFAGQLSVFDWRSKEAPCYHCLFPDGEDAQATRCATMGVFAPLVGLIGAAQATEVLKLLVPCGEPLSARLLLFDALQHEWQSIRYARDPACAVCAYQN